MTDENRFDSAHTILAADRYRRSRGWWRIATFLALVLAVLALLGRFAPFEAAGGGERIARVAINGTITSSRERLAILKEIAEDDRVRAVIVSINSPGGTTAGGEELYEALGRLREAKPVVAVIDELGASAAYMTAIAADRVFARRLSIVGSIGVLYQHVNAGELLDTIGIDLEKIASGPLKAEPDISGPLTPPVRVAIGELVADSFEWFVDIVAERRGLTRPAVLGLADGRIVTGRVGVAAGLIDAIGGEAEALAWLESEHGIDPDMSVATLWPRRGEGLGWIMRYLGREGRVALGLPAEGPVALDGLVSLWQVD